MSSPAQRLRNERKGFINEIKKHITTSDKPPGEPNIRFLKWLAIASLIGATLPSIQSYRLFGTTSALFLTLLALSIFLNRKTLERKVVVKTVATVSMIMLLTGCSGISALLASDPVPLVVVQNPDKEYKSGYIQQIGVFGLGLDNVSEQTAMQNGNIEKAYATQTTRSFGWISVARVRVYGE